MDLLFRRHGNKNKPIMVPVPGYPLFRNIQPGAWSRKKGIHGLDPLELPVYQLCRYEASRVQSSPFECRQVCGFGVHKIGAESVFTARQLKSMRENAVDIDSIANHVHQTSPSTTSTPSKNGQPVEFIAPLAHEVVTTEAESFAATEGRRSSASTCTLEAQLKAAQDQLAAAGLSDQPQSHTISPKQPPKHSPSSTHLGSTPKRKARKRRRRLKRSCPRSFRLKSVSTFGARGCRRRPQNSRVYFWRWWWCFFCFPFRKLWTLLLLCLNSTNLEAFRRLLSKMVSNVPDGDPATCDEDHTDFGWFWCHENRSSASSHTIWPSHGHVIES